MRRSPVVTHLLPSFLSLFECLVLLRRPLLSLSLCLAFPHSIIILSLAPSVESLEWPPPAAAFHGSFHGVQNAPSLLSAAQRTVEQKGVHPSLWPSLPSFPAPLFPLPSPLSLAPVRLRSEGKKMKNDVVVALLSLSLSLSLSRWSPRTEVRRRKMSAMGHIKVGRRHEPMTTTARSPATPRHTIERTRILETDTVVPFCPFSPSRSNYIFLYDSWE